jgi:hypothetical protein
VCIDIEVMAGLREGALVSFFETHTGNDRTQLVRTCRTGSKEAIVDMLQNKMNSSLGDAQFTLKDFALRGATDTKCFGPASHAEQLRSDAPPKRAKIMYENEDLGASGAISEQCNQGKPNRFALAVNHVVLAQLRGQPSGKSPGLRSAGQPGL